MNQSKTTYIALLRGINVGGNNIIKMPDLKACFEKMDFSEVVTYIQSGNVVFKTSENDQIKLTDSIEDSLAKTFGFKIRVVTISEKQLKTTVKEAPKGFGSEPMVYRYEIIFLKKPLTAKEAIKSILLKEGVDQVHEGKDVLYFSKLIAKAAQSKISRVVGLPIYQDMTIRNWNTTTKLLALTEKEF